MLHMMGSCGHIAGVVNLGCFTFIPESSRLGARHQFCAEPSVPHHVEEMSYLFNMTVSNPAVIS